MRLRTISLSVLLHVIVVILFSVGAGWLWTKKEIEVTPSISVEIIKVAEKTQTNKKNTKKIEKKSPIKKLKKKPKQKKTIKKPLIKTPKKPPKAATNKSTTAKTPILKKKDLEPKKTNKKLAEDRTKAVPKPPKKPPLRKEKKHAPEQDFSSMLKNLADGQEKTEIQEISKPVSKKDTPKDFLNKLDLNKMENGHDLPLGTKLTISEIDLLRRQLSGCWSIPIGARDAESLIIDIFMVVNSDRTVHHAKIVDQSRYRRDGFFRAAADSALRAVYNRECSPLELPVEKYTLWKEIIVTFDPRNMF